MYVTRPKIKNLSVLKNYVHNGWPVQVLICAAHVFHHEDPTKGTLGLTLGDGSIVNVAIVDGQIQKVFA